MTESIKKLLIANKYDEAFLIYRREMSFGDTDKQRFIDLVKQYPPEILCDKCGSLRPVLFQEHDNYTPWHIAQCHSCARPQFEIKLKKEACYILSARGLDHIFKDAKLSDFDNSIIRSIPTDSGAYIWGPCGTGKTHLLSSIMIDKAIKNAIYVDDYNELRLAKPEEYPLMTSINEILINIRRTYDKNSEYNEARIIDKITEPSFVFLDDIGTEKPTDWALQTIFTIIDRRYRDGLVTFFSSNISIGDLSKKLGDRIASRIAGMCSIIKLTGKDRRIKNK
jgi:DNA replication protein DnaC